MSFVVEPPVSLSSSDAQLALMSNGYAVLSAEGVASLLGVSELDGLSSHWSHLEPDNYLKDGGRYRKRRHSSHIVDGEGVHSVPHRPHWQPLDYNALHGGMERWFAPIQPELASSPAYLGVLGGLARWASQVKPRVTTWYLETHLFRIDTQGGIGRPTPEGAHRDGVDFVAVFLVDRHGIKGGETRVFDAHGPQGQRFTLMQPWSMLWLDDERVIHETTPIQPVEPGALGWRDTLVITLRQGGFQDPI